MNKQEILKKARQRIEERDYIDECIEGLTCPECGGKLQVEVVYFENKQMCRPRRDYKCKCGFLLKRFG